MSYWSRYLYLVNYKIISATWLRFCLSAPRFRNRMRRMSEPTESGAGESERRAEASAVMIPSGVSGMADVIL